MGEHRLRLNLAKADQFWCPINKFALAPGFRLEGTLPLGVNLKYIQLGVYTGKLIDVNGTVLGGGKKGDDNNNDATFTGQSENQEKPALSTDPLQEGDGQPAGTESGNPDNPEGKSAAKADNQEKEQVDPKADAQSNKGKKTKKGK